MASNLRLQLCQAHHELYELYSSKPSDPFRFWTHGDVWEPEDDVRMEWYRAALDEYYAKKEAGRHRVATLERALADYIAQRKALKKFRHMFA